MELVNQGALAVKDFEVDFSNKILEVQLHLSIVGIRSNIESPRLSSFCRRIVFLYAVEGTEQPVAVLNALRGALVIDFRSEPNGVIYLFQNVNLAV